MSISTVCKALFCFNCTKPEEVKSLPESKIVVPMPPVEEPKVDVEFKAFRFKYIISHIVPGFAQPQLTYWTSELYFDYRQAREAASNTIRGLTIDVNKARHMESINAMMYHKDFGVNVKDVITVNAYDVFQVTIKNGVQTECRDIILCEGDNIVFQKPETSQLYYRDMTVEETA
jgi:hypothetical protein